MIPVANFIHYLVQLLEILHNYFEYCQDDDDRPEIPSAFLISYFIIFAIVNTNFTNVSPLKFEFYK